MRPSISRIWTWFFDTATHWVSALLQLYRVFFFFFREIWPIQQPEKKQNRPNCTLKKQKTNGRHSTPLNVRFKYTHRSHSQLTYFNIFYEIRGWKFECKILKIERGIAEMPFFPKLLDLYMHSSLSDISWWVANWATRLTSIFSLSLQHCHHQISSWSKICTRYEFSVKKLVFWGFRVYLGEIESREKNVRIFHIRFFPAQSVGCQG